MLNDKKDQSVIISGESGAGKSEATKLILQFISELSARYVLSLLLCCLAVFACLIACLLLSLID
jgi:hypothetical protein